MALRCVPNSAVFVVWYSRITQLDMTGICVNKYHTCSHYLCLWLVLLSTWILTGGHMNFGTKPPAQQGVTCAVPLLLGAAAQGNSRCPFSKVEKFAQKTFSFKFSREGNGSSWDFVFEGGQGKRWICSCGAYRELCQQLTQIGQLQLRCIAHIRIQNESCLDIKRETQVSRKLHLHEFLRHYEAIMSPVFCESLY